jgi:hypothetical protein
MNLGKRMENWYKQRLGTFFGWFKIDGKKFYSKGFLSQQSLCLVHSMRPNLNDTDTCTLAPSIYSSNSLADWTNCLYWFSSLLCPNNAITLPPLWNSTLSSKLQFENWKSRKLCSVLCVHSDLYCSRNSKRLLYSINLGLALTIMSNIQIWAWLAKAPFTSP